MHKQGLAPQLQPLPTGAQSGHEPHCSTRVPHEPPTSEPLQLGLSSLPSGPRPCLCYMLKSSKPTKSQFKCHLGPKVFRITAQGRWSCIRALPMAPGLPTL